jgi:hypothetical protein
VRVRPSMSTRYIVVATHRQSGCQSADEVWVGIKAPFTATLETDGCGHIHAAPLPLPAPSGPQWDVINDVGSDHLGRPVDGQALPPLSSSHYLLAPPALASSASKLYTYRWNTGSHRPSIAPRHRGHYRVRISNGRYHARAETQWRRPPHFPSRFSVLAIPKVIALADPQSVFRVHEYRPVPRATATYNAQSYRLTIRGPQSLRWENTIQAPGPGFMDGQIAWDPHTQSNGLMVLPGRYHWRLSLTNCRHLHHSHCRRYRIRRSSLVQHSNGSISIQYHRRKKRNHGSFRIVG